MRFSTGLPGLTMFPGLGGQPSWAESLSTTEMIAIAQCADELGYDYLVVTWHHAMPRGEWVQNMGARWPHSTSATGYLLGATQRIKLLCLVVVPAHHPIELAKALATLDWMSGGRLVPVLLVGYLEREFEMLGVPFAERHDIMDEYVEAMVRLWSDDEPSFAGRYVDVSDVAFEPKPAQRPLPIWFGCSARSKRGLDRIARWGSGWMSYASRHAEHPAAIERIRSNPTFSARATELDVSAYFLEPTHDQISHAEAAPPAPVIGVPAIVERIRLLASLGITTTGAALHRSDEEVRTLDDYMALLAWFADEVMPEVAIV